MNQENQTEVISMELQELVPRFLENSRRDHSAMLVALDGGDMATLKRLGHSIKGAGAGYGFQGMSLIGSRIQNAAQEGGEDLAREAVQEFSRYLAEVKVVFE